MQICLLSTCGQLLPTVRERDDPLTWLASKTALCAVRKAARAGDSGLTAEHTRSSASILASAAISAVDNAATLHSTNAYFIA